MYNKKLPKLPYGEGSMSWSKGDLIVYKKTVKIGNESRRISVYGSTPKEAIKKMKISEAALTERIIPTEKQTLSENMLNWIKRKKAPVLKPTSFDRIMITFTKQIEPYSISKIRWNEITADDIQDHLNKLVSERLARTTIKKVYDLLNNYYNCKIDDREIRYSPMQGVVLVSEENVLKRRKDICYLSKDEIPLFIEEAERTYPHKGTLVHKDGPAFVLLIYTGLRIGELIALQWKDIDFEKKTMSITKTTELIINREYDDNNPKEMERKGIKKQVLHTGSTKTYSTRVVALNSDAILRLQMIFENSKHTRPDDYVVCTVKGTQQTATNLDKRVCEILRASFVNINSAGAHMLRHTCASKLFEQGVQVEIIASILGHSPEVCRGTYIHFCQEQQAKAIHRISEFNAG